MKLSKYFLSAFAFIFAIGGALASFTSGTIGWVATTSDPSGVRQAFSATLCSTTFTDFICTEGSRSDVPVDAPNGKAMFADPGLSVVLYENNDGI